MPEDTLQSGQEMTQTAETPQSEQTLTSTQTAESAAPSGSRSDGTTATEAPVDTRADEGKSINDALSAFANEGAQVKTLDKKPATQQQQTAQQTAQTSTQQTTQPQGGRRDYSGLDEQERIYFRDMDAKSFAYLKPIYLEYKKQKSEIDTLRLQSAESAKATFFENPDAYQLTPEYRHSYANLNLVNQERAFWKSQLVEIRNGRKWTALVGYDDKGNPQYAVNQEPTAEAEADVTEALLRANQIGFDLQAKVNTLKDTHATNHKGYLTKMSEIEDQIFKGADKETLNKAMTSKLVMFPEHRRGNPEVQLVAKLLAVIDGYSMLLDEKKAAAVTADAKTRTLVNGGPPPGARTAQGGKASTVAGAMAEFDKARAAGVF